jgi:drug/metabolite transporter (DMT)-like permease
MFFFSILAIPYLFFSHSFRFGNSFWIYVSALGIIDAFGNIYLVRSLKSIDLSVFGPLNAYKPIVALLLSAILIHEIPSLPGLSGVLIIIGGSYILYLPERKKGNSYLSFLYSEGVGYRFLSIVLTSIAAVFSKKVIIMSSPLVTLSYWSLTGLPVVMLYFYFQSAKIKDEIKSFQTGTFKYYFGLLSAFLFLQIFSLYTFKYVYVGYSLALFQLSSVISVFFGSKVFKEGNIKYRYLASVIMIAGTLVIVMFG